MEQLILGAAADLAAEHRDRRITLDEVAAVTGLKKHHLAPYRSALATLAEPAFSPSRTRPTSREVG
ncbi:hypothetical protein [Amycolatopsis sp. CA-230715]|uniref:hypothetical protein n=1 Tax=Amycolatopsis sp. CA-230715 TaxID=2745196 RepID=UPI001C031E23|nr:hypothetical protein [Amycolatopsis sp. CA-230715]QWF81001.1 hypothetical protein HUW46_04426 [Amycolatopsis sp. CA-230715]